MGPLLGLSQQELNRFGLADLVMARYDSGGGATAGRRSADVLRHFTDISDELDKRAGRKTKGAADGLFAIPGDYFLTRALSTATGPKGGYLVGEEVAGYALTVRNRGIVRRLPVKRLDGLAENATLVRGAGSVTVTWQAGDGTSVTASDPAVGQLSLSPKSAIVVTDLSRQLLIGMGDAGNAYVAAELQAAASEEIDKKFVAGIGGAEPIGVLNTQNINSQAGASLSWSSVCDMLRLSELYGEGDSLAWLVAPDAAKVLRTRERATGNGGFILSDGTIAGYPALVSGSVPAGSMVIGTWSDVTVATWGSLHIDLSGGGTRFNSGLIGVRMFLQTDWAFEKPVSITKATSIT